jgi:hypothetical protein
LGLFKLSNTLLAGRFFRFVKLAPFDRNKGAARGRWLTGFIPKQHLRERQAAQVLQVYSRGEGSVTYMEYPLGLETSRSLRFCDRLYHGKKFLIAPTVTHTESNRWGYEALPLGVLGATEQRKSSQTTKVSRNALLFSSLKTRAMSLKVFLLALRLRSQLQERL